MMAMVIIGVGVLAFVDAQAAFTASNNWSSRAATGMLLANEVREFSRRFPRHDPVTGLSLAAGSGGTLRGWGSETGEATADDMDDLDDLDGVTFGESGVFAGPIDAFGDVVPDIAINGDERLDEAGEVRPLRGWSQRVIVEKVSLYDFTSVLSNDQVQAPTAQMAGADVDEFPLRVTVIVEYTDASSGDTTEVTRVTWVVPVD